MGREPHCSPRGAATRTRRVKESYARNSAAWPAAQSRNVRAGAPVISATVDVTSAGCPIAAAQASSSIFTTNRGMIGSSSRLASSGEISSTRSERPMHHRWSISARIGSGIEARSEHIPLRRVHPHTTRGRRLPRCPARRSGCRSGEIRPAHGIAGTNLRRPPVPGIRSEHSGPQKRPLDPRGLYQPLDFRGERSGRVGLLKEGVCRFDRSGEKHDAPRVLRDPLQCGSNGAARGGPHQEHRLHAIQACIQGLGECEIPSHHLNLRGQTSRVRVARQRADLHAATRQLRDNLATDVPVAPMTRTRSIQDILQRSAGRSLLWPFDGDYIPRGDRTSDRKAPTPRRLSWRQPAHRSPGPPHPVPRR